MTADTGLGNAFKGAVCARTMKLFHGLGFCRMFRHNMIIKRLLRRRLIVTVLAFMLERSSVLRANVHMDRALILLDKGAMRALELSCRRT